MKYLAALIIVLFASQSNAAENLSQQTGGNYIYAENGKLTFNLEPSLFENRQWQFDKQTDNAVSAFEINLPIKTKNASSFHSYELSKGFNVYDLKDGKLEFVKFVTEPLPKGGLVQTVYNPRLDQAQRVQVWLPAMAWTVRIVGAVARQVLPPIITRCMASLACASVASVTAVHLCAISYDDDIISSGLKKLGLPESVCMRAKEKGWKKSSQDDDTYEREYKYSIIGYYGNKKLHEDCPDCSNNYKEFVIGADTLDEAKQKVRDLCKSFEGQDYQDKVESSNWYGLSGNIKETTLNGDLGRTEVNCHGIAEDENHEEFPTHHFAAIIGESHIDKIEVHDINDLIVEDFVQDPTPYINDNGQVGKELRKNIESSASLQRKDGEAGELTATSEAYIDPETGDVRQDILFISTDKASADLALSGNASGGGGGSNQGGKSGSNSGNTGIPAGRNNVSLNTINRPDLANEAKPASNNLPNGTGTDTQDNRDIPSGNSKDASGVGGLNCDSNKDEDALACAELGSVSEQDFGDIKIPTITESKTYTPDNFLPVNGICPIPKVFSVVGKQYSISYEPICKIAKDIRFAVLIAFAAMAAMIAFGGLKKG